MTITLTPCGPDALFGPGFTLHFTTNVTPTAPGWEWFVTAFPTGGGEVSGAQFSAPMGSTSEYITYGVPAVPINYGIAMQFREGEAITLQVWLLDERGSIKDVGNCTAIWSNAFLGNTVERYGGGGGGGGGGLTPAQSDMLLAIYEAVVTSTFTPTVSHPGISGSGLLQLQTRTRAIRWTIDTFPNNPHVDTGEPDYYFNFGFITPLIGPAWDKSRRVTFESQVMVLEQSCHSVSYDLSGGVSLTITELVPPTPPA